MPANVAGASLEEFQDWIKSERMLRTSTDNQGQTPTQQSVQVGESPCRSLLSQELAANGALTIINLACHFLTRQIQTLAQTFETEGGFTERLYRVRKQKRN